MQSNSRENQDLVCVILSGGKKGGSYLEVGGATPVSDNNTCLLEKEFGWRGVSLELNGFLVSQWKDHRSNPCLCKDATVANYDQILEKYQLGPVLDFLQLDIDPHANTLKALERLDLNKYSFAFATFEHDLYRGGEVERRRSREIFQDHGYTMLISDVMHDQDVFEDWYVLEDLMTNNHWKDLKGSRVTMNGPLSSHLQSLLDRCTRSDPH